MNKINFKNGVTKVNADTFNTFQDNIEKAINEATTPKKTEIAVGNVVKINKLAILNISTTKQQNNVENNKPVTLITLATGLRPNVSFVVTPVVGRDEKYEQIPNCYVILRSTGVLEFYQTSGATKNVRQILGQISYFID